MFSLAMKTAIVTGGASGIGLAIVRRFKAAGALVLVADRRADGVEVALGQSKPSAFPDGRFWMKRRWKTMACGRRENLGLLTFQ